VNAEYSPQRLAELLEDGIVLTDEQAEVIGAPLSSRLVVAGAGSGKTFVMAMRVIYLVANGIVEPGAVLGLTFTRKAAGELNQRIRSLLARLPKGLTGGSDALQPAVSTYDAYASSIVRSYGLLVGADPDARVLTGAQRWGLARDVVEGWAGDPSIDVGAEWLVGLLLTLADQTIDNGVEPDRLIEYLDLVIDDLETKAPWRNPATRRLKRSAPGATAAAQGLKNRRAAARLIGQYRSRKAEAGVMDFADQAAWARRLATDGRAGALMGSERERFAAVLLDEFQDTSTSQIEFLSALFGGLPVMAVGDPNQSIYGWRGASATALDVFKDRFHGPDGEGGQPPPLGLTVARRNDKAILGVANRLVEPLRQGARVRVGELRPRPDAGPGRVDSAYFVTQAEEAEAIAAYLSEHWSPTLDGPAPKTAAILVRARSRIDAIAEGLEAAGIDYEVIGRGGLLRAPEVRDVVSALTASQDLSRGDAFMRLASSPRFALGIKDLDALNRLARRQEPVRAGDVADEEGLTRGSDLAGGAGPAGGTDQADGEGPAGGGDLAGGTDPAAGGDQAGRHQTSAPGAGAESPSSLGGRVDGADRFAVLDALDLVMDADDPEATSGISAEGLARLRRIGHVLKRLRQAASYLSLPELVLEAEKALDLDLDLLSARGPAGRSQINQLVGEAHNYAEGQDQASLDGFLSWLRAEEEIADGLELADVPQAGAAVQILTVHGAKGLEWDIVCVPGMRDGAFPAVRMTGDPDDRQPSGLGWLSDARGAGASGGLPWPLRLDQAGLPRFEHTGAADVVEVEACLGDFKRRVGHHFLAEDRRVAYVAVTRAKSHLFLSGFWYATGTKTPCPPSVFLEELAGARLVDSSRWAAQPTRAPLGAEDSDAAGSGFAVWPQIDPAGTRGPALVQAAGLVKEGRAGLGRLRPGHAVQLLEQLGSELADRAALLIREREQTPAEATVLLPEQASATTLIGLAGNVPDAVRALRRPVPSEPNRGASLGEEFHRRAALELSALGGKPVRQEMLDSSLWLAWQADSAAEAQLRSLMAQFRQSRWMSGADSLVAAEAELEIELAGRAIVARVDAVFRDADGRIVIVDWKTGRSDRGQARPLHAEQVRLYQAAWAMRTGARPDQLVGYVHYIMEDLSVPVACPPDYLDQLAARLEQA
jgi:DNA helicase-2/ATP-dependent DNA helicase PcrA